MKKMRNALCVICFAGCLYVGASVSLIESDTQNFYAKTGGATFTLKCGDPGAGLMDKTLYRRNGMLPFDVKVGDLDEVSGYPTAIGFADDQTGFITVTYHGQDFPVYMTDDGGNNWHGIAVDAPVDIIYNYIDGENVAFDDSGKGTLIFDFVSDDHTTKYKYDFISFEGDWEPGDLLETVGR